MTSKVLRQSSLRSGLRAIINGRVQASYILCEEVIGLGNLRRLLARPDNSVLFDSATAAVTKEYQTTCRLAPIQGSI